MTTHNWLGEILIELGVLTPAEVERVSTAQGRRGDAVKFGQMAKKLGLVTEEQILAALAVQMGVVPINLKRSIRKVLGELKCPAPKSPLPFTLERVQRRIRR
jgi:c-di-GMP-binding flagellar brake protein YcgR